MKVDEAIDLGEIHNSVSSVPNVDLKRQNINNRSHHTVRVRRETKSTESNQHELGPQPPKYRGGSPSTSNPDLICMSLHDTVPGRRPLISNLATGHFPNQDTEHQMVSTRIRTKQVLTHQSYSESNKAGERAAQLDTGHSRNFNKQIKRSTQCQAFPQRTVSTRKQMISVSSAPSQSTANVSTFQFSRSGELQKSSLA